MEYLTVWQLITDVGLVTSLIYLALRFGKRAGIDVEDLRLQRLEKSLKELVHEAGRASSALNDDLGDRQKQMEQLLFDLETVEHRVNRAINNANDSKRSLDRRVEQFNSISHSENAGSDKESPGYVSAYEDELVQDEVITSNIAHDMPEPPSFDMQHGSREPGRAVRRAREGLNINSDEQRVVKQSLARQSTGDHQLSNRSAGTESAKNIFGQEIKNTYTSTGAMQKKKADNQRQESSLAEHLEKEVDTRSPYEAEPMNEVEDIYAAAEELLRAGKDLQRVASETNLPLEEIKAIARILESEEQEQEQELQIIRDQDQRLGVLGGIKRQNQVL